MTNRMKCQLWHQRGFEWNACYKWNVLCCEKLKRGWYSLFFMFHTSTARHAAWHVETTNLMILDCEVRWKKVLHNISVPFDTAFKRKGTKKNERCLTRFAQQMFPRIKLWVLVSKCSFSLNKSQLIITKVSLTSQSPNSMPNETFHIPQI